MRTDAAVQRIKDRAMNSSDALKAEEADRRIRDAANEMLDVLIKTGNYLSSIESQHGLSLSEQNLFDRVKAVVELAIRGKQ